jgi:NADH-quinone oxidoreductase subunit L
MWIGSLALAGVFPFAGYWSKDAIISAAWASGSGIGMYGWVCTVLAAFLTAFYSGRLLFMTFHGTSRADHHTLAHVHESPWVMVGPLCVLAVGATLAGWLLDNWFIGADWPHFWNGAIYNGGHNHVIENLEHLPFWVQVLPLVLGALGLGLSWVMYIASPLLPMRLAQQFGPIYRFLLNKWYFDELYNVIFVQPALRLARLFWQVGDVTIIDGVPNGLAELTSDGSREVVKIQTGSLAVYAFAMLIGVVALITWYLIPR